MNGSPLVLLVATLLFVSLALMVAPGISAAQTVVTIVPVGSFPDGISVTTNTNHDFQVAEKILGSSAWIVAEGSTGEGFDTFVLITNTEDREAKATVTFMTDSGPVKPMDIKVGANSRCPLRVSDYLPNTFQVSTLIKGDSALVVERSMYWDTRAVSSEGNFPARPYECIGGHSANGMDP